jgi:hypothetical protein
MALAKPPRTWINGVNTASTIGSIRIIETDREAQVLGNASNIPIGIFRTCYAAVDNPVVPVIAHGLS